MDREAEAIAAIMETLGGLDEAAQKRVIRWAGDRVGIATGVPERNGGEAVSRRPALRSKDVDLAEFFARAGPETDVEKVLVAAVWFQERSESDDLDSQPINTGLKQLGHGVSNVTRCLGLLMTRRPRLVIQTKKAGTAKQARKRYRVTSEGISEVERMMTRLEGQELK